MYICPKTELRVLPTVLQLRLLAHLNKQTLCHRIHAADPILQRSIDKQFPPLLPDQLGLTQHDTRRGHRSPESDVYVRRNSQSINRGGYGNVQDGGYHPSVQDPLVAVHAVAQRDEKAGVVAGQNAEQR